MTLNEFMKYCLEKSGVTDTYPMRGETVWMKVGAKMFALANVRALKMNGEMVAPFHLINLKCDPAWADDLRLQYPAIIPAWHQNKKHWNSLIMAPDSPENKLPDTLVKDLIDHSYEIVVKSLPKSERAGLGADNG